LPAPTCYGLLTDLLRESYRETGVIDFGLNNADTFIIWLVAGVLADRLTTYVVGFNDHCAGAAPPELVFVSRDNSPVRVRVWVPWRHDVVRLVVAVLYKDRPRRIVLPATVRVVDNGTDNKGNEITPFCYSRLIDTALEPFVNFLFNCEIYNLEIVAFSLK